MEDRKATKGSEVTHKVVLSAESPVTATISKASKEQRSKADIAKASEKKTTESQSGPRKSVAVRRDTTTVSATAAITAQRDAAMRWASGEASDTDVVTQSTICKVSGRQRGVKNAIDKGPEAVLEDAQSLEAQNFIAAQYPPIEEGVSSTVRLGRALVSGALGRRNDDPKSFGAAISIQECSVRFKSTKKKAKAPVSAAPPNSIDSEVDCD